MGKRNTLVKRSTVCKACQRLSSSLDLVLQVLLERLEAEKGRCLFESEKHIPLSMNRHGKDLQHSLPSCILSNTRGTPAKKVGFNSIRSSLSSLMSLIIQKQQHQLSKSLGRYELEAILCIWFESLVKHWKLLSFDDCKTWKRLLEVIESQSYKFSYLQIVTAHWQTMLYF